MARGSIEKRGDNTWRLTVDLGFNGENKRNRQRKTITVDDPALLKTTKRLNDYLEDQLAKFKIEVETGAYISPDKMKFKDFIEVWKDKYASDPNNLSPATLANYETVINVRLLPVFGHIRIDKIQALQIVAFLKELEKPGSRRPPNTKKKLTDSQLERLKKPLDAGTVGYIHRVFKNILSRAVEWNVISVNPMAKVKKPAPKNAKEKLIAERENPQYYNEMEAQLVVDALYQESRKWRLLILGSMIGGFRRGELVGLEWTEVDFDAITLTVENNIPISQNGVAVEKGPKSLASYRDVDMPEWYMKELKTYQREWQQDKDFLEEKWQSPHRQYVFHNGKGGPYYYQHPSKWWRRFCQRHGLRYIKFHGLRHSSGTILLEDEDEANFDSILIAIQKRLGHARLSTTTDTYVHVTKKVKRRTAGKFDKFGR